MNPTLVVLTCFLSSGVALGSGASGLWVHDFYFRIKASFPRAGFAAVYERPGGQSRRTMSL
jgi:hypothetical protein